MVKCNLIKVNILDGRFHSKREERDAVYKVSIAPDHSLFDFFCECRKREASEGIWKIRDIIVFLFVHIMLESKEKAHDSNYEEIVFLLMN